VKFIFATTEAHRVPQTILSRCQRYDFKRLSLRQIATSLEAICKAEDIEISDGALLMVAREAEGSMRDSQSLLDQVIAYAGKKIGDAEVVAGLGVADRKVLYAVGRALVERKPAAALDHLAQLHLFGYDLRRFARELLEHLRNLSVARLEGGEALLADLAEEERAEVRSQAEQVSAADLDRAFRILLTAEDEIGRSAYPKLILEMAAIKIATMPPVTPIDDVLQRLDALAAGSRGASPQTAPTRTAPAPAPRAAVEAATRPAGESVPPAVREPAQAPQSASGDWDAFVAFVGKEKMMLAPHLKECVFAGAADGTLELAVPKGFHHDYLARRENLNVIQELAGRFYGRQMKISMRVSEAAQRPAKPAVDKQKLTQEVRDHPTVRTVLDILGGEVKDVKPRGAAGE